MSLTCNLYINKSPVEALTKTISDEKSFSCLLKEDVSILRPKLIIATSDNISGYNYLYISDFSRYYFIDDIVSLNDGRWEISAHVDVLATYAAAIKNNEAVIRRQVREYNTYLNDPEWKVYSYEQKIAHKFTTTPFLKGLSYVLTVAGA